MPRTRRRAMATTSARGRLALGRSVRDNRMMLRRGGALALLLAGLLALAPVPNAVAKRARHRSPCGTFCRQAGGLGGSPGTPPCKVLNRRVNVHAGLAA